MKKLLLICMVLTAGGVFGGCVGGLSSTAGGGFVKGAISEVKNQADAFALKKNKVALDQAVSLGAKHGLTYEDVDKNGDGLFSDTETWSFGIAVVKAEGIEDVKKIVEHLKNGDIKAAKEEAKDAKNGLQDLILKTVLGIMAMGAGSYKYTMYRRNSSSAERVDKRLNERPDIPTDPNFIPGNNNFYPPNPNLTPPPLPDLGNPMDVPAKS